MPHDTMPYVAEFVKSLFRQSQQKTLALVIAALAEIAQAASLAVAGPLAVQLGFRWVVP